MEYISGKVKLRDIFLHNHNWLRFFILYWKSIRPAIIVNVLKLIACRTTFFGYSLFKCPTCPCFKKAPHSCKGRFCPCCGKKATDNWIIKSYNQLPKTSYQHITFTMPSQLWDLFWFNRYLMNLIPKIAANIVLDESKKQGFIPGIFLAIHTFGRKANRNYHLHMSTTVGGLSLDHSSWVNHGYYHHLHLKNPWKFAILNLFEQEFIAGRLKLPKDLQFIRTQWDFRDWIHKIKYQTWNVHLAKQSDNMKKNVDYLGKYLKRPPIGETRIHSYDGKNVTFEYLDHYTNEKDIIILPVLEFIARIISHIPDKYFRNIRYYGFLANRVRGKLLPIVYDLLQLNHPTKEDEKPLAWRELFKKSTGKDPLICPCCKTELEPSYKYYGKNNPIRKYHRNLAMGMYPLRC